MRLARKMERGLAVVRYRKISYNQNWRDGAGGLRQAVMYVPDKTGKRG